MIRHYKEKEIPGKVCKYTYYPEFDGEMITLEAAYRFYEECDLIHLFDNGVIKCYQEFMNVDPEIYCFGELKLTDCI